MVAIDAKGRLVIVEIKVSRADLLADRKWADYLDYCDLFYWAVPGGFGLEPFEQDGFGLGCAGLILADRYDAEVIREAPCRPLAAARRKAETVLQEKMQSLAGGLLLGLAAALFILLNGRVLGISGILAGLARPWRGDAGWSDAVRTVWRARAVPAAGPPAAARAASPSARSS